MFKALVNYVDAIVPDSIAKERVAQLKLAIAGLQANLKSFLKEGDLVQKGGALTDLIKALEREEPRFLDKATPPEKQLAVVVAFGTLRLMALRERILHAKEYYGDHPSSN